ncbi:hypothetical protein [Cyclobacterium jeungdonense]|uniref:Uncharacterized protein n=1 Tax=Cyclobacterium jeungdonense TaxID=708087 RepID=A0ABT8C880_9BACT|nr:hypothetical protein [Cyclobacterium jeungdonense]MDN3688730.1 hypothetical protein [Cyclobacterium jeungdonense]
MRKSWVLVVLLNFLIASVLGLLLRAAFVWEISWMDYRYMLHGHSHVALLGWLYLGFFLLIHGQLIPQEKSRKTIYSILFWITQVAVLGMAVAFPLQGYAGFSIFFATLHIFSSYLMVFQVWRDHDRSNPQVTLLLKTALVFLVLSTLGVWTLAAIMATGGKAGLLYQVAIQFYLHFQFNGWLLFILLALLVKNLSKELSANYFQLLFRMLLFSQIFTFSLVIFWAYQSFWAYLVHGIGAVLQFLVGAAIIYYFKNAGSSLSSQKSSWPFAKLAIIVVGIRVLFELLLVFPDLAEMAIVLRPIIVGFIHLNMLGLFSAYLLFVMYPGEQEEKSTTWLPGSILFFYLGFVGSELYLFVQGIFYWLEWGRLSWFYEGLFITSCFLSIGIIIYIIEYNKINYFEIKKSICMHHK